MKETLLIVNADDLGATVPVNDAIFSLMEQGIVTSATLLANGAAFEDAVARLKALPQCSFGVHLNLTQLRPVNPTPALRPVLNAEGMLYRSLDEVLWTPSLMHAMYLELEAQVQRCIDAGVRISHFDSHHHTHTIPWIFPIIKALQWRFGVNRVRGTINIVPVEKMDGGRSMKKSIYRFFLRSIVPTRVTEGLGSFMDFYTRLTEGLPLDWRSMELMVHPGATSPFGVEEEALLRADWRSKISFPYRMGTFWNL
jgi:predicted glycoside hydrolase/deacetylase ChbG (UPF0249 family)